MKLLFGLAVLLLIAASFIADYKWKKWIEMSRAARKQERVTHDYSATPGSSSQDGEK